VVNDGPGFFTSRVLAAFLGQAILCYQEGASADRIDRALVSLGFPVGPMTLIDEVGLDVAAKVMKVMNEHLPARFPLPLQWSAISGDGRLGKKSSLGFYRYAKGKKEADNRLHQQVKGDGPCSLSDREIQERCLYAFLCESLHCYQENILENPDDGDLASVFGLGFPPFLGGPFFHMRAQGIQTTLAKLTSLASRFGAAFQAPGEARAF